MDAKRMIGQRLAVGFSGTTVPAELEELIREYKIGNVILFRENLGSGDETRQLCAELQRIILRETGIPALISIDEEGGIVSRMPPDCITAPGNMAVAATGDPENAAACAAITSRQLRSLGINLNLAPVLDINNNPKNPVIGVRSWGDDPDRVIPFVRASVREYVRQGMMCCGKHFPGHGDTDVDSHIGLPSINKSLEQLEKTELRTFRAAVEEGIPAIMTSHILFPQLEPDGIPATMSRRIMTGLLREKMGFDGVILSDSMTMDAIRKYYGTVEGTVSALNAGVDIVFVCHEPELQKQTAQALNEAWENGTLDRAEMTASVERVLACKKKYAFTDCEAQSPEAAEADRKKVDEISGQAVVWVSGPMMKPDAETAFVGCRDYRQSLVGNRTAAAGSFPEQLHGVFGGPWRETSFDPDDSEIREVVLALADAERVIVSMLNGHLKRGQINMVNALAAAGKQVLVIAMRDPYDLSEFGEGISGAASFDSTPAARKAVINALQTGVFQGCMPVGGIL